jgi:hypothetical protein
LDYEDALGPWLITTPRYSSTQVGTTIVISGCEVFGSKEYNIELQWRCLNSHAIQRFGDWIVSPINSWDNYVAALKQSAAAIVSLFIVDQTWWLYKIMLVSYVISINYMVHPEKVTRFFCFELLIYPWCEQMRIGCEVQQGKHFLFRLGAISDSYDFGTSLDQSQWSFIESSMTLNLLMWWKERMRVSYDVRRVFILMKP